MNIIFCHVLYSPPISMLVNHVFEISGEAEMVLTIMPIEFSLYIVMLMKL